MKKQSYAEMATKAFSKYILDDAALKKLHACLLIITDDVDKVCRKYSIKYMLSGGSCLGAVRHKNYIFDQLHYCVVLRRRVLSAVPAGRFFGGAWQNFQLAGRRTFSGHRPVAPAGPPFGGTRSCGCRGSAGTAPFGRRGADAVSGAGLQLFARLLCRRAHRYSRTGRRPGRDAVQPGLCMAGAGPREKA